MGGLVNLHWMLVWLPGKRDRGRMKGEAES